MPSGGEVEVDGTVVDGVVADSPVEGVAVDPPLGTALAVAAGGTGVGVEVGSAEQPATPPTARAATTAMAMFDAEVLMVPNIPPGVYWH